MPLWVTAILQGILKLLGMGERAQISADQRDQQDTGRRMQQADNLAATTAAQEREAAAAAQAPASRSELEARLDKGDA